MASELKHNSFGRQVHLAERRSTVWLIAVLLSFSVVGLEMLEMVALMKLAKNFVGPELSHAANLVVTLLSILSVSGAMMLSVRLVEGWRRKRIDKLISCNGRSTD